MPTLDKRELKRLRKEARRLSADYSTAIHDISAAGCRLVAAASPPLTPKQWAVWDEIDRVSVASHHVVHGHSCAAPHCIVSGRNREVDK